MMFEDTDVEVPMPNVDLRTSTNGAKGSTKKSSNYTCKEDIQLCISWQSISSDPIIGNEQPGKAYLKRITEHCHANRDYESVGNMGPGVRKIEGKDLPPLPEPPRGRITSPRLLLLSLRRQPASSRLSLLARAPSGRAVAALGLAAAFSPPVSPPFRGEITGDVSSPAKQWRCRHCTASSRPCRAAQVRAGCAVSSLGVAASTSTPACPRFHRNAVARVGLALRLTGVPPAAPSAVPVRRPTSPSPPPASQRQGRPRPRLPSIRTPPVFVIVVSVRPRRRLLRSVVPPRRLVVSLRRLRCRIRSGVFHAVLVSVQLLLAVPRRLLAGPGHRRRRPPVVPGHCGVRPFVKPFSSVVRVRQVCRCSPVVVFVLASASSSLVPAASRLRPRIAAEVVPLPFVSVVPGRLRRARSSLLFPRLVAWWLVALLVCFA
ncbi:uncharacterized protein [Oryza sativa Japonica Group]|uniref:uncharacterized protein n=1 Tax=Oryza sativa subsp. japonica TaxID=39947 RepID=UPI00339D19D5